METGHVVFANMVNDLTDKSYESMQMAYAKYVTLRRELVSEIAKGFDTPDERYEVFLELADYHDVSLDAVYTLYWELANEQVSNNRS